MLRLLLLRHAKSSWDHPGLDDFRRPLAPRGIRAAPRIGAFLRDNGMVPDRVVCSPAQRALETWELVRTEIPHEVETEYDPDLYLASRSTILGVAQSQSDAVRTLMLVGHNPGTEVTALGLCAAGPEDAMARLRTKVPTAALVEILLSVDRWRDVEWGGGTLGRYVTPKWLAETGQ